MSIYNVQGFKNGKATRGYVITDDYDKVKLLMTDNGYDCPEPVDIEPVAATFVIIEKVGEL